MSRIQVSFERIALVRERVESYELPKKIDTPDQAYKAITAITSVEEEAQEVFGVLILNTKHKIVAVHEISRGTLSSTLIHPREVFKLAVLHNAAAIICFHNHPSGDPKPSADDIMMTKRLVNAGDLLGIQVLDHVIIGDGKYVSFGEEGWLR